MHASQLVTVLHCTATTHGPQHVPLTLGTCPVGQVGGNASHFTWASSHSNPVMHLPTMHSPVLQSLFPVHRGVSELKPPLPLTPPSLALPPAAPALPPPVPAEPLAPPSPPAPATPPAAPPPPLPALPLLASSVVPPQAETTSEIRHAPENRTIRLLIFVFRPHAACPVRSPGILGGIRNRALNSRRAFRRSRREGDGPDVKRAGI